MNEKKIIWITVGLFAIILVLLYVIWTFFAPLFEPVCVTPFYVRDAETDMCEVYIGCELPEEMTEDEACEAEIRNEVGK